VIPESRPAINEAFTVFSSNSLWQIHLADTACISGTSIIPPLRT
jgi:hypothetical protein